jgi:ParB family chromosome partitioning protein
MTRTTVPAPEASSKASAALDTLTGGADTAVLPDEQTTVDPRTLTLDTNVRSDLKITARFKKLIEEHGVLVPLLCRRDPLGNLLVVDGQRRLVAALELGLDRVPIAMIAHVGDDEARIWDQLVTNDGNERLNAAETAGAFQQLTLMGRSADTIARRAALPREAVDTALTVAQSKAAAAAAKATPDADLDQLAVLAEFEDDKEVVARLRKAIAESDGRWRHMAQAARDDRAMAAARQEFIESLPDGVTVLGPDVQHDYNAQLDGLLEKPGGRQLTAKNHAGCPGHAVHIAVYGGYAGGERTFRAHPVYVCTTWKTAGHAKKYATSGSGATSGPQTDDQKAARRTLIANNKAAIAAESVRREFIRELLQRKTLPTDAAVYVAAIVRPGTSADYNERQISDQLLYGDKAVPARDQAADRATPARAMKHLVALAAARVESQMPKDFWRKGDHRRDLFRTHLTTLASWGYELSDVEQIVVEAAKP